MNQRGKNELIKSLAPVIEEWIASVDANSEDRTDIGFVGERTPELLASLVITALELNGEAQQNAVKEGYLAPSVP